MEFRILGPLEILCRETLVQIPGSKQPKALAMLLLEAGSAVSVNRLVDALWEFPPHTAKRQVQNSVAALRRTLAAAGHDPIQPAGDGYRITADNLDATEFSQRTQRARELSAEGRHAQAHAELCAALDLWRGPALAGLSGRILEAAALRWEDHRLSALEDRLAEELTMGQHGRVVTEARQLLDANPYRQHSAALLMRALHRDGRTPEALQTYDSLRIRLAEDLGIDPESTLYDLYIDILRDNELPEAEAVAIDFMPNAVPGFTGRWDQLSQLSKLIEAGDVDSGPPPAAVISGTGGVGKTTLAIHWAHSEEATAAFPDGRLFVNLQGFGGKPVSAIDALQQLLWQLGVSGERAPQHIEAAQAMLLERLERGRYLILLDDAADAAQVRPLLVSAPGCLTIVTSRDLMNGLAARHGARRILLDLLSPKEAEALTRNLLGAGTVDTQAQAAARLIELCARLPLAIQVAAAGFGTAHPDTTLADYTAELAEDRLATLDAGGDQVTAVASVLSWSTSRLSADMARQFCLLGVHPGPRMDAQAAAALLDVPATAARRTLRTLAAVSLCKETSPGLFSMHDLLREHSHYLAETLHIATSAAQDRLLGHYAEQAETATPTWVRQELPSLLACVQLPHSDVLSRFANSLGKRLMEFARFREAYTALHVAREASEPGSRCWLYAAQGLARVGPVLDDAHPYAEEALRGFRELGEISEVITTIRFQAEDAVGHGDVARGNTLNREALRLAQEIGDQRAEADAITAVAYGYSDSGNFIEMISHATRGAQLARQVGDRSVEAIAAQYLGIASNSLGHREEARTHLETALRLHRELGDDTGVAQALSQLGLICLDLGDPQSALHHCQSAIELQRETKEEAELAVSLVSLGRAARATGNATLARESYVETGSICQKLGNDIGVAFADIGIAELCSDDKQHEDAIARYRSALSLFASNPYPNGEALAHDGLGRTLLEIGDHKEARKHLLEAIEFYRQFNSPKAQGLQEFLASELD